MSEDEAKMTNEDQALAESVQWRTNALASVMAEGEYAFRLAEMSGRVVYDKEAGVIRMNRGLYSDQ